MGKRFWLTELLNNEILPSIAQLSDSDEGKAQCQKLAQTLRDHWIEHGQTDLRQQQSLMDQTRRVIKDKFGDGHFSLDYIKFTTEEYTRLNDEKQRSVAERNEDVKQIENPDGIVAEAVRLLDSPEWAEVAAGLAVLTGRRSSELLSTAQFEPKTHWSVVFTGALKRKGEMKTLSFEIPTLTTSKKICQALTKVRQQLPEAQTLPAEQVNARYGQAVADACDRHFANLVPTRSGGTLYTHLFRAIYATIATFWYCPAKVDPVEFRAAIQGHFAVLDEANPELRRSLAASRHYADFEIADKVVAQYAGKRKGIKLGVGGVQAIEAFENSMSEDQPTETQRKHRSSLRIWREDHDAVTAILEQFEGKTQQDKVAAWIEWSKKTLAAGADSIMNPLNSADAEQHSIATDEGIEDEATKSEADETHSEPIAAEPTQNEPAENEPIQSSQPIAEPLNQPVTSGLESKIDGLVGVMTQFIQMQMAQMQSLAAQPIPVAPVPTSPPAKQTPAQTPPVQQTPAKSPATEQGDLEETPKRRYKTGEDEATINAAIDAIMAHNDAQELHDLKWAITINTLKAFSKNQRIIERILGKGKDNPNIDRLVGEREAEIEQHHQQHQIQPGHNNRHKRKRKIGDVIQL
jgi:Telomere resolvase